MPSAVMSVPHLIRIRRTISPLLLEPSTQYLHQARQVGEPTLPNCLRIEEFAAMEMRLPIQHQAKDQDDLALPESTSSKRVEGYPEPVRQITLFEAPGAPHVH